MTLDSTRLRRILPAVLLTLFSRSAQCGAPNAPARTVEGIATTQAGKPLAHLTLYLFGLPPGDTDMMTLGDQTTVVTDDQGRFAWFVPPELPDLRFYINTRDIECYALAADRGTEQFRLAARPNWRGADATGAARDLLEQATRECRTRWQTGGARPVFAVVVPDMSAVLLTVRGPDAKPLRAREVEVVPTGQARDYQGGVVYTGRTDAEGGCACGFFPALCACKYLSPAWASARPGCSTPAPVNRSHPGCPRSRRSRISPAR